MFSVALGASAQGTILLEDISINPYVDTDVIGNYYTGVFGIEVWALYGATLPAGINLPPAPGSGVAGYNAMVADGFTLEATFANQTMNGGLFFVGNVNGVALPTIPGGNAVIALAVWNTSASSWSAMLGTANGATRAGVIAFVNVVTPWYLDNQPASPLDGWTEDLVMAAVPEPGTLALAGMAIAIVLVLGRRR